METPLSRNNTVVIKNSDWRNAIYAALASLIFPIIIWIIDFRAQGFRLSYPNIILLHQNNPVLYIVDLVPLIIGTGGLIISLKFNQVKSFLQYQIEEKEENILKYARFAQLIGKKEFSLEDQYISEDDELGKALLFMSQNLSETNKKEDELNWIARGKEQVANILRLYNNIDELAYKTLIELIKYINAIQGSFYIYDEERRVLGNVATYAHNRRKYFQQEFDIGKGLIGQAAFEMDIIYRKEIPSDYFTISSGILGDKKPSTLLIVPLISDEKLQGVIEFASLEEEIPNLTLKFVKELGEIIAQTLFNLKVNKRTEKLLKEAQEMTQELKKNEEQLRKNAIKMKLTQEELEKTNINLEAKIIEVENAQKRLYSLLENASEVISIYDKNGIVKYESPSVKHILGYSPDEVIGKNAFENGRSKMIALKNAFAELLENPSQPITFEFKYEKNEGESLWLETTGRNLLTNPAIAGIIFNTRDITVRKIAEKAQRMSGQMQALSENSPDMIVRFGMDGKFFYVNPIVKIFTGIDKSDLIQKSVEEVSLDAKIIKFFRESIDKITESQVKINTQINFPTKFGERIMQVNFIPEYNELKELETILFIAHDITEQKRIEEEIKDKNKAIGDSINYAQRIQSAIIPDNSIIREYLPNSFIFYKPRDIISGDFPWFFVKGDDIYIAAVDCTGHGVPGALLSFIGYFLLNNIVDHDIDFTAAQILDSLHLNVRKTLKQDLGDTGTRDGMDIAFCKINHKKKEVQYAGAHRPLYYVRNGELTQYRGNPKAIGGIPSKRREEKDFINHIIEYQQGDKVFFFSDGLPDQIGGAKERKYQVVRIREAILGYQDFSMNDYHSYFEKDFIDWKGNLKQIDDVLLIGIEF